MYHGTSTTSNSGDDGLLRYTTCGTYTTSGAGASVGYEVDCSDEQRPEREEPEGRDPPDQPAEPAASGTGSTAQRGRGEDRRRANGPSARSPPRRAGSRLRVHSGYCGR